MKICKIKKIIDNINYWDAYALDFRSEFFGDECRLFIEESDGENDEFCWEILCKRCFKVYYDTDSGWTSWNSKKHIRNFDMKTREFKSLMSHSVQNIEVKELSDNMIKVHIILSSMSIIIICQDVIVSKVDVQKQSFFWNKD